MIDENVLVVGDLHLGVNKNNPIFYKTSLRYADWLDAICKKKKIKTIIQVGDIFHNREVLHVPTMNCANDFFNKLKDYNIHIVAGNHDCLYNETAEVNSLKLLNNWPNITIHEKVDSVDGVCFVGWGSTMDDIPDDQRIIFGHFNIKGFLMNSFKVSEHGFTASDLMDKCQMLMSGHYHKPQTRLYNKKPLIYTGSAYQMDWGESGEEKYVYLLNTKTLEYKPVPNNISPKFEYIRSEKDYVKIKNNFVSIEIENPEDFNATVSKFKALDAAAVTTTYKPIKIPKMQTVIVGQEGFWQEVDEDEPSAVNEAIDEYIESMSILSDKDKKLVAETLKTMYNGCI